MTYLYGPWETSPRKGYENMRRMLSPRDRYILDSAIYAIPGIGDLARLRDDLQYMDDYLRNTDLSYDDILYRSKHALNVGSTLNFVSSNVHKLYGKLYSDPD